MTDRVILTVALAHHAPYLRLSHELLADSLNGWRWLLVDNSGEGTVLRDLARDLGMEWIRGPAMPAPIEGAPAHSVGSLHHAQGLACGLEQVSGRHLLILDPDFFLVREGALALLLQRMEAAALAALGVPWTPELHYKWRGAPCLHCVLLDLDQVPREALQFEPDPVVSPTEAVGRYGRLAQALQPLRRILSPLHQLTSGRIGIGHSRDTGYRLARWLLDHRKERIGLLPAAVVDRERFRHPWHLQHGWGWWLERRLPRTWSYLPPDDHFRRIAWPSHSRQQPEALGIDLFCFDNELFGVHVRRSRAELASAAAADAHLMRVADLVRTLRSEPQACV